MRRDWLFLLDQQKNVLRLDRILYIGEGSLVQTVSYSEARNRLASLMEQAERDREPISITRNGEAAVVLLAAEEYEALQETLHLLSTPANAERIRRGLKDYAAGKLRSGKLCD